MVSSVRSVPLLLALVAAPMLASCGGGPKAKVATVRASSMPDGASWDGVYFSPLFGTLHLVSDGERVTGKWLRPRKDFWGKLQGTVDGNVMHFSWDEFNDGLVGPNSKKSGRGYFVYSRPDGENVDDVLKGEAGRGQDELGSEWVAVKQRLVKPDLESIGGAGASSLGGGDWDKGNSETGSAESPSAPAE